MNKPEVIAGIAVSQTLSADASLAMDGWIRGYLYPNGVCKKLQNGYLCYYPEEADDSIGVGTIAALNDYLRDYVEPDDPKPFRIGLNTNEIENDIKSKGVELISSQTVYGIKVPNGMNPDAALALDGWIHGYFNGKEVHKIVDKKDVYYYVPLEKAFNTYTLTRINRYLEPYLEPDDPKPVLAVFMRSKEYIYAGTAVDCEQ